MTAIYEKMSQLSFYEGIRNAVEYALIQLYSYSINIIVKAYLDGFKSDSEVIQTLDHLRRIKSSYVKGDYNSPYITGKIKKLDIDIMRQNDLSPKGLLTKIKRK